MEPSTSSTLHSNLLQALQGLQIQARTVSDPNHGQPRNLAALHEKVNKPFMQKNIGNEHIVTFIAEAEKTPEGRAIQRSIKLDTQGRELSIKSMNKDGSEATLDAKARTSMPIAVGNISTEPFTRVSLADIKLPQKLVETLSTPLKKITNVQEWLISHFLTVNFEEDSAPIQAKAFAFTAAMPVSGQFDKADYVPVLKCKQGDTWMLVVFNSGGEHYAIKAMEFNSFEPSYLMQGGLNGQQHDWSSFRFPAETMRVLE